MSRARSVDVRRPREQAFLVGLETGADGVRADAVERSLEELARLCDTAGARVVGTMLQRRPSPDVRTFVGSGKVEEIRQRIVEECADLVVFDDPLTPAQQRNLERALDPGPAAEPTVRVIDRSQLILDIFAQRAHTIEGKLQVELAQLEYLLPRLTRHWTHLSRIRGGGVGSRGPGETQLEVDRRRVRERVASLRKRIEDVSRTRDLHRRERAEVPFPMVALVGYTNAGKSTLMRALTGADVLIDDRLFATLDPTIRRLELPRAGVALLSDTVGFIHKLPHQLIEAFKSTLEEVRRADLLVHVIDASNDEHAVHIEVVKGVLDELGVGEKPTLLVWNKVDSLDADTRAQLRCEAEREGGLVVSARSGENLDGLRLEIDRLLRDRAQQVEFFVPFERGEVLARLHREGRVIGREDDGGGTRITALVTQKLAGQIRKSLEG